MKGSIRTRERCPKCSGAFQEVLERKGNKPYMAMKCPGCSTTPRSFYIFIYLEKDICPNPKERKQRITKDQDGHYLRSYEEANRLLEAIRKAIDDGTFNISDFLSKDLETFKGKYLFPQWLATKSDKAPTHTRVIGYYIKDYFLPYFGEKNLKRLNDSHIEDFYYKWLPARQIELERSIISEKTKKNIMTMLANFCRWLERRKPRIINAVPYFPEIHPPDPEIKWIRKAERAKILDAIPEKHRAIFLFMLFHPLRPGEARALKVKDVDMEGRSIHVCRAFSLKEIRARKNKKDYCLPLSITFNYDLLKNKLPEAWLFTTPTGRPYSHEWLSEIWRAAFKAAGLPYIQLKNATRHSIASQALNDGVALDRISAALGHSSVEITRQRYAKLEVESLREVIDGAQVVHIREYKRNNNAK